jgi:uncharacterized protein (TIGR03067 family)
MQSDSWVGFANWLIISAMERKTMKMQTKRNLRTAAVFLPLILAFGATVPAQSITGEWEVAGGAMYGQLIPSNVAYTMTLNITGDQFTADSGNLKSSGKVTFDDQATPGQITFKIDGGDDPGRELKGIFKFEGRNLMITFSETDEFPTAFESTADNRYLALSYQANTGRRNLARDDNAGDGRGVAGNRRRPATPANPPSVPPQAGNNNSGTTAF